MTTQWRRRLLVMLFVIAAFLLGSTVQDQLGISFSVEGLQAFRQWVQELGWWGPAAFVLLVIFRLFIGLSSHLVLILGGLVFGVSGGLVWGCLGLVISALLLFYLARLLGADWVQRRFGNQYTLMLERIKRVGAVAIFAITAHPVGLLTPAHLAAGLVNLDVKRFTLAIVLATPIRTAPYVMLGTAVLDLTGPQSMMIAAGLVLIFVLPLLNATVREWLWGTDGNRNRP